MPLACGAQVGVGQECRELKTTRSGCPVSASCCVYLLPYLSVGWRSDVDAVASSTFGWAGETRIGGLSAPTTRLSLSDRLPPSSTSSFFPSPLLHFGLASPPLPNWLTFLFGLAGRSVGQLKRPKKQQPRRDLLHLCPSPDTTPEPMSTLTRFGHFGR
ncbi:unnamed protein product [Protopolystoma xenopodis]|uniref:Uncharacterized protein n=1 Tax=Protopolystoma xenopodis TaxID=117903 RepID=A0A3S5C8N3_9PLAT|nr:unnamed protein product [Protopolystoma xenopodis]